MSRKLYARAAASILSFVMIVSVVGFKNQQRGFCILFQICYSIHFGSEEESLDECSESRILSEGYESDLLWNQRKLDKGKI